MYTSDCPDSLETYATHRPSGENAASVSANGVASSQSVFDVSRCTRPMSKLERGVETVTILPSGDHELAHMCTSVLRTSFSSPEPSDGLRYSVDGCARRSELNMISRPSGDQICSVS